LIFTLKRRNVILLDLDEFECKQSIIFYNIMEISGGVAMFKGSDFYGLVGMGKRNVGQMYALT